MRIILVNSSQSLVKAVDASLDSVRTKIFEADSLDSVTDDIKETNSQVVILNWARADIDAIDIVKRIRRLRSTNYVYIILVVSRNNEEELMDVISAGADDFIYKPFGKEELQMRMTIADRVIRTENNYSKSKKKLIRLAKEDSLTGLFNRRALLDESVTEMERAARDGRYISTIMAGITNFRELLDEKGGMIGDMILLDMARRLEAICRPYDKLGRYGLAEFMMLLPDTGSENAEKVVHRLLHSIQDRPFEITGLEHELSIAVGISELNPSEKFRERENKDQLLNDLILENLLTRTEEAMKDAERSGTNKYVIHIE